MHQDEHLQSNTQPSTPVDRRIWENQVRLWPCVSDYGIFDEVSYQIMTDDDFRKEQYLRAIHRFVKDKVAVDIGTGPDLVLARMCIEAGAKRVHAIEVGVDAYQKAKNRVDALGLADRIMLHLGDARQIQLQEQVDVSVSEVIGMIGSSEGVVTILNGGRRFLKPDGVVIPYRCVTKVAAAALPAPFADHPHFCAQAQADAADIFRQVGHPVDLRVCIEHFPVSHLLSDAGIFEDLNFQDYLPEEWRQEVVLEVTQSGRMDGLLLWIELNPGKGLVINSLTDVSSWWPLFLPVLDQPTMLNPGDRIAFVNHTRLSEDNFRPEYLIDGKIIKGNGEVIAFAYVSTLYKRRFRQNRFYQQLFDTKSWSVPPDQLLP